MDQEDIVSDEDVNNVNAELKDSDSDHNDLELTTLILDDLNSDSKSYECDNDGIKGGIYKWFSHVTLK